MLLFTVGCVATGVMPAPEMALAGVVTAWLLVLAFRVIDDLIDRDHDRGYRHPDRVTVRANRLAPFLGLAIGAFLLVCALTTVLGAFPARAEWCIGLTGLLAGWSWLRPRTRAGSLVHAHVILAKYPLIAVIASPDPAHLLFADAVPALGALYLGFCLYEALDDPLVRGSRGAGPIMAIEGVLLAGLQLFTLTRGVHLP